MKTNKQNRVRHQKRTILTTIRNCNNAFRRGSAVKSTYCSSKGLGLASSTHSKQNTHIHKIKCFKETVTYNKQKIFQQVPQFFIKFLMIMSTHIKSWGANRGPRTHFVSRVLLAFSMLFRLSGDRSWNLQLSFIFHTDSIKTPTLGMPALIEKATAPAW